MTQDNSLLAIQQRRTVVLLALPDHSASWRDVLVVDLALGDACVQQRRGSISWHNARGNSIRMPITALADGTQHRYIVPVGTHPGWRGDVDHIQVAFPAQAALHARFTNVQLVQRTPLALDQWLMQTLIPYLPVFPRWPPFVVLVLALLVATLALLLPKATTPQRLALAGALVGCVVGTVTVLRQLSLVVALLPILDWQPVAQAACAPTYHEAPAVNTALFVAATHLPDGPVLVVHPDQRGYLVDRARYLFAPRRVDTLQPPVDAAIYEVLQEKHYVALVTMDANTTVPVEGWQQLSPLGTTPIIWRSAGATLLPTPDPAPNALSWLLLSLACVAIGGWGVAALLGLNNVERMLAAWPLGASLLAWWMFALDRIGLGWSWWNIVLLLLATGGLAACSATRNSAIQHKHRRLAPGERLLVWMGLTLIGSLVVGLLLQATLLPFGDIDTWRAWSFKAQGFFRDGVMTPTLTRYPQTVLDHLTYPPAQPLLQTWGYIAMGGLNERLVKLVFPCWYVVCVGLLWLGCTQWATPRAGLGWALLFATTPLVLDHATLGNADLPFAASYLVATLLLTRWVEQGQPRALMGALVVLAGLAWLKLDGIYLGLFALIIATVVRAVALRHTLRVCRSTFAMGSFGSVLLVLSYAPWKWYLAQLGLHSDLPATRMLAQQGFVGGGRALGVVLEEMVLSHANSAWGLLGGSFGALWLICGGALLYRWQRLRADHVLRFLVLLLIGGLLFYAAIYTLRPYSSIDRYLLHLAPIAVLAAARAAAPFASAPAD